MSWSKARTATLENDVVLLRPVAHSDAEQFRAIVVDADIWRYFIFRIETQADLDRFIADAVNDTSAGTCVAFSIVVKASQKLAGSMAYLNMAEKERRLE